MKGVLLDTSILIEHFKGNSKARNVLLGLIDSDVALFINPIVFSEVVYLLLGFYSGVSPRSLKSCLGSLALFLRLLRNMPL